MKHENAVRLIKRTFESAYDEENLKTLVAELFQHIEIKDKIYSDVYIPAAYKEHISSYKYLCKYVAPDGDELAVLAVNCSKQDSLDKARTLQRNFVANYMKERNKDACLVAFYSEEDRSQWRFSFVRVDNSFSFEVLKKQDIITPAKRYSYMVGEKEASHTAQQQLCDLLESSDKNPDLDTIESAFAVEKVSNEFFERYKELFLRLVDNVNALIDKDYVIQKELVIDKNIPAELFCKKLLGQIVFLYFIQKKGWLGVEPSKNWGTGDKRFMRTLFEKAVSTNKNYFNDLLEPLFYEALASERKKDGFFDKFNCKIPFLNGGLFEPIYDWQKTDIILENSIFSNERGDGILDVFDRYNFTVREDEPLEKEIAVDPEMLGKVFENLLEIKDRKSKGAFYTPREIVHYMCQQSLVQYINTKLNKKLDVSDIEFLVQYGDVYSELQDKAETTNYEQKIPEQLARIKPYAEDIDNALANVKVFDPAIGSGAFPVGMMHEIIRTRQVLLDAGFVKKNSKRTIYEYKRQIIRDSIYGVDIEESAVEIAKLRLWLSLIVDEEDFTSIKPLPNLDYKIVCGNSLKDVHNILATQLKDQLIELQAKQFDSFGPEKAKYTKKINEILVQLLKDGGFDLKIYFPQVFDNGGFDIVIANPPYIGEKGNKKIFEELQNTSLGERFHQGKMDYFYYFFHLALDILKTRGVTAFITTNYYITAAGGRRLRTDFKNRATIHQLINFNELKIFASALGQHNMITILTKGKDDNTKCKIINVNRKGYLENEFTKIINGLDENTNYNLLEQTELYETEENYIRVFKEDSSSTLSKILAKIQAGNRLLDDYCFIHQGLKTNADKVTEAHLVKYKSLRENNIQKDAGIFVLDTTDEVIKLFNDDEKLFLKPLFKNSDIKPFIASERIDKYVLYITKSNYLNSKHPHIKEHLDRYMDVIRNRAEIEPNGTIPLYSITRPREDYMYETPKIIAPYRSRRNIFAYNECPWYASGDVYYINSKNGSVKLKYILGLLNSKLYYVWLYNKGKHKGDMFELYQKPLSEVPIKYTDNQIVFVDIVDKIIAKRQNGLDSSVEENKLNELVYNLYGLTEEEIQEVERLYPKQ